MIVECFHCLLVYCLSKLDSVIYKNPSCFQWNAVALWAWGKFKCIIIIIQKLLLIFTTEVISEQIIPYALQAATCTEVNPTNQ